MTNKIVKSLLQESEAQVISELLTEKKKEFLLSDQKVLEKIVIGLQRDLKYL